VRDAGAAVERAGLLRDGNDPHKSDQAMACQYDLGTRPENRTAGHKKKKVMGAREALMGGDERISSVMGLDRAAPGGCA